MSHCVSFCFRSNVASDLQKIGLLRNTLYELLFFGTKNNNREIKPFASIRGPFRRDMSDKDAIKIIVSFIDQLAAKDVKHDFDSGNEIWSDTEFWHGYNCLQVEILQVFSS